MHPGNGACGVCAFFPPLLSIFACNLFFYSGTDNFCNVNLFEDLAFIFKMNDRVL